MHVLDFDGLKEMLSAGRRSGKVMLTFHSVGDTDAVASAYALNSFLANSAIAMPDTITANAKRILERLGLESNIKADFMPAAQLIIMLDVNNFEDCGAFESMLKDFKGNILIIDHHLMKQIDSSNVYIFNSERYSSTSSIVLQAMESMHVPISKNIAILLALGILSDSAEFKNSSPLTFEQMGRLLDFAHIDYPTLLEYMQHIASPEDRAELLLKLSKASIVVKYGMVFMEGFSEHNANILADDAIKIGADVALFYSTANGEISFSARLRPPLDKEYGIHLGYIMKELAPIIGGSGGGHPCAAGAYGRDLEGIENFIEHFNNSIRERIERKR
ncbi:MAG: DHH family phosphoesterase [Candidatus Micrarchaeaceae archaeon]